MLLRNERLMLCVPCTSNQLFLVGLLAFGNKPGIRKLWPVFGETDEDLRDWKVFCFQLKLLRKSEGNTTVSAAAWGRTLRANRDTKEDFVLVTEWLSRVATDCCLNGRRNWRDVCSIVESSNPKMKRDFSEAEFPVGMLLWGTSPLRWPANITFCASSPKNDAARFELSTTACKTFQRRTRQQLACQTRITRLSLCVRAVSFTRESQASAPSTTETSPVLQEAYRWFSCPGSAPVHLHGIRARPGWRGV